jgi:hypothetical protein
MLNLRFPVTKRRISGKSSFFSNSVPIYHANNSICRLGDVRRNAIARANSKRVGCFKASSTSSGAYSFPGDDCLLFHIVQYEMMKREGVGKG